MSKKSEALNTIPTQTQEYSPQKKINGVKGGIQNNLTSAINDLENIINQILDRDDLVITYNWYKKSLDHGTETTDTYIIKEKSTKEIICKLQRKMFFSDGFTIYRSSDDRENYYIIINHKKYEASEELYDKVTHKKDQIEKDERTKKQHKKEAPAIDFLSKFVNNQK